MIIDVKTERVVYDKVPQTLVTIPLLSISSTVAYPAKIDDVFEKAKDILKEVSWFGMEVSLHSTKGNSFEVSVTGFDLKEYIAMVVYCRRKSQGMTQKELASACGYKSVNSVARIENGHDVPSLKTLVRIFDALGVSLSVVVK